MDPDIFERIRIHQPVHKVFFKTLLKGKNKSSDLKSTDTHTVSFYWTKHFMYKRLIIKNV